MPLWKQRLLARYMAPQQGEGGDGGGGGGEGDAGGEGGEGGQGGSQGEGEGGQGGEGEGEGGEKKPAKPTDAEAKLIKENMKKKAELKAAQDALAKANERLAQFDGLDAAELKQLVADKKAAEEAALAAKGDFAALKKRMAEEHSTVVKAKDTQIGTLQEANSKLAKQIEELTVGQAFASSSYIPEETVYTPGKARKVYGEHVDVVDGEVVVFDKPRGANGRSALVDQYGNNMPFEAAIAKLVDMDPDKEHILKAKVRNGAGSSSQRQQQPKKEDNTGKSGLDLIGAGLSALKVGK